MSDGHKIKRIEIHNYGCIELKEIDVPPGGFVARGRNRGGKTTILRALRACLVAHGLNSESIRHGSEKAELVVDLDELRVRRSITRAGGGSLKVMSGKMTASQPQSLLREIVGSSVFDPVGFFAAKAADRRKMLIEAMPATVTPEFCAKYDPDGIVPPTTEVHGLLVIEQMRRSYYDARRDANRAAKEAARALNEAIAKADAAPADDGSDIERALTAAQEKRSTKINLDQQKKAAQAAAAATEKTRARILAIRDEAKSLDVRAKSSEPGDATIEASEKRISDAKVVVRGIEKEIERLNRALVAAQEELADAEATLSGAQGERIQARRYAEEAAQLRRQAGELDETLGAIPKAPTDEELTAAGVAHREAENGIETARAVAAGRRLREDAATSADGEKQLRERAERLDRIVTALTNDAPAELLASTEGVPGITLGEDDKILLNGVLLDELSGAEQMKLAIDIARKLNATSKILIVDGLEALDPEQFDAFVAYASRDDWQLIGTRVERGDVVIEPIGEAVDGR